MNIAKNILIILIFFLSNQMLSQGILNNKIAFTKQDSLRGSITNERKWWDLNYYHLDIKVSPETKTISGKNTIQYTVLESNQILQIDLQSPLLLTKVTQNGEKLSIKHQGNAHFIKLLKPQKIGDINTIHTFYEGQPKEAIKAPWDGGISWNKDNNKNHFIASSCQGIGASVWWPNKDHMYDEVDSMLISVNVPKGLMNISNGKLRSIEQKETSTTYNWFVSNPINNYGVNINIGDYANFSEVYKGEKGNLQLNYFVLKDHLNKAKRHFKNVPKMMKAFEYWFGPYPFYQDSYKLVEAPYLGMEHQSSITYGNRYKNGYLGKDLSGTGWGLKFDFIIVHESGHEWFANNITNKDVADMWIHESFAAYSESLYLDYHYGTKAGADYIIGTRRNILNDKPIIGIYDINKEGSFDMYYKGANMLHTLRQLVNNDKKWRNLLRDLNKTFYHQTVSTEQIEKHITDQSGLDLKAFFNQYLRSTKIPLLEYKQKGKKLCFKWSNTVDGFAMPIQIEINGITQWITPSSTKRNSITLKTKKAKIAVDKNFYVDLKRL